MGVLKFDLDPEVDEELEADAVVLVVLGLGTGVVCSGLRLLLEDAIGSVKS